jgi:L-threonate 2-dehydrogenase
MVRRSKGTVGVVGLGKMGGAFAKHLVAAGWRVLGYDIDAGRKRAAARAGAEIAPNVSTLAKTAPVIITSLPDPDALAETVAEITKDKLPGKTIVETSTFRIEDKERAGQALRKAGHVTLDCPVSPGRRQGHRDLCERRQQSDRQAQAHVRRILTRRL